MTWSDDSSTVTGFDDNTTSYDPTWGDNTTSNSGAKNCSKFFHTKPVVDATGGVDFDWTFEVRSDMSHIRSFYIEAACPVGLSTDPYNEP